MSYYFITPEQKTKWLVIWRALASHRLGIPPQEITLQQMRKACRMWSYEGSEGNSHYFKFAGRLPRRACCTPTAVIEA